MTVANGGEEKQEHDVKKEPEEKNHAMMQVDPPPPAAPAPAVEVANATPPLAPPVPQQQQQQQQLPQRKMIPNPQDVNKAASIASERALIDAKKAISVRLKFKSKEGGKGDEKKDDFFRTAKDVLETLMPFHAFADQRGLFQFDPSFPSSLMVDDDEDNKNKNARRKKLRLLREAVGMYRENAKIDPKFKDTPWKDNGYVAWNLWGGAAGVDWAIRKIKKLRGE